MLRWTPPFSGFVWLCPKSPSLSAFAHHTSSKMPHLPWTTLCWRPSLILRGGALFKWLLAESLSPSCTWRSGCRIHAPAVYISSLDQSKELVTRILGQAPVTTKHMTPALLNLAKATDREDWTSIDGVDVPLRQHQLSKAIDQAAFDEFLATAPDTQSKALVLSSSTAHVEDWLSVILSSAFGLCLHDWEFRLCLQYWLGLWMVEEGTRCPVC